MKISIITVTLNSETTITETIESVIRQNYKNIEFIIIDGGSLDNTLSIVNSKKKYISTLISEPDNGVYDAMNKGIQLATGEAIGFLNSDDLYAHDEVLSKVSSIFEDNSLIDACFSDLIYTAKFDTSKNIRYWKSNDFSQGLFSKGWSPPHPTFFVRSSIYKKFGNFNLNYNIASDIDLMMRFLEVKKINTYYIPEVMVKMRMGGISNKNLKNIIKLNKEILYALKSYDLPNNYFTFFANKILSRFKQFFIAS